MWDESSGVVSVELAVRSGFPGWEDRPRVGRRTEKQDRAYMFAEYSGSAIQGKTIIVEDFEVWDLVQQNWNRE
jgi:hypothetical protein